MSDIVIGEVWAQTGWNSTLISYGGVTRGVQKFVKDQTKWAYTRTDNRSGN